MLRRTPRRGRIRCCTGGMKCHNESGSSVERLIRAEAHNSQAERIDGQFVVLYHLAEDIGNAGRPSLTLEFGVVGRIGVDLLKLNASRIRRLPEVIEDDV